MLHPEYSTFKMAIYGKSIGVLACLIQPTANFLLPEPVAFWFPGLPKKRPVNTACCSHGSKRTKGDQRCLLPDIKSLVILQKSSMTRSKIKRELILERHLIDGDGIEQRRICSVNRKFMEMFNKIVNEFHEFHQLLTHVYWWMCYFQRNNCYNSVIRE